MARERYREVDVICRFPSSQIPGQPLVYPLRIRRGGGETARNEITGPSDIVEQITCHWVSLHGAFPRQHLSLLVSCNGVLKPEALELIFDTEKIGWSERTASAAFAGPAKGGRR